MPKRIMITDDALFMRVTLKNILTSHGFEVAAEATNGQEAVNLYANCKPDAVLMDITMPTMDGITAARTIKSNHPNAKIIMCTAMGQKNMVIEAIQAGASDFIVKPFQPERVVDSINKILS